MAAINYIGGITLGKIFSWDSKTLSSIEAVPMPTQPASSTVAVDTLGVVAYVNLRGRWTGQFAMIQIYVSQIKSIIDGYQTSSVWLRSPFVNSTSYSGGNRIGSIGTVDDIDSNKLIDSSRNFFLKGNLYGDLAKNLDTGEIATILSSADGQLTLGSPYSGSSANLFTEVGQAYAVTSTIPVKLLNLSIRWGPPGLSYCDYELNLIQVA